jgi:hypothetical protein
MGVSRKRVRASRDPSEQERRSQEVLRASKELAAYFKGRRTEREARAAIKIIKAFVKDRERTDPANRGPLPGLTGGKAAPKDAKRHALSAGRRLRPTRSRRHAQDRSKPDRPEPRSPLNDAPSKKDEPIAPVREES